MWSKNPIRIVQRESLFLPYKEVKNNAKSIIQKYTHSFFQEKVCSKCEWLPERHAEFDVCQRCPAFIGSYQLAKKVKVGKNTYLKVPVGATKYIQSKFPNAKWVHKSPTTKISPFEVTEKLHDFQTIAVKEMIRAKRGVLQSPPRSGKTVMAAAIIQKLQCKTLILASQREWLLGFQETFIGSSTQKGFTNISKNRIGFCKKLEDFEKFDICLATIQSFYSSKGAKLLSAIKSLFPVIVVDEVHYGAADKFIGILGKLNARYIFGLSGTPERKDEKFSLINSVISPVAHKTNVEVLRPTVKLVRTKLTKSYAPNTPFHRIISGVEGNPKRIKLIAKHAIEDMEKGHSVLIPVRLIRTVHKIISEINKQAGRKVAFPFYGGMKKEERDITIQRARLYKRKIIVGQISMVSTGINIPRLSCLYEVAISSNIPKCTQRVSRILTKIEDKPSPILKLFLDNVAVRKRCLANEWFRGIVARFKPIISEKDSEILHEYFKEKDFSRLEL